MKRPTSTDVRYWLGVILAGACCGLIAAVLREAGL